MSTRCNIIVKDKYDKFWLYHHCDGYPEGVGADLVKRFQGLFEKDEKYFAEDICNELIKDSSDNYELTGGEHGDIEYLYTLDLERKELYYRQVSRTFSNGVSVSTNHSDKFYLLGE